jgi:4-amino-4-deoxy-L-arabinose transferase-like glycosyltransferase
MLGRNAGYLTAALPAANLCGLMAVLAIIAAPLPHVLAIGLLPDTLLTPLSLGLMLMALRWTRKDHFTIADWIITGLLLGLAGLSKYTAAFTAFALLAVFLASPKKAWITKAGFWVAAVIAFIVISPVLYWNWIHDWISFKYQIAHGSGGTWAWRRVGLYILQELPSLAKGGSHCLVQLLLDPFHDFCLTLWGRQPTALDHTRMVLSRTICWYWPS